MVNTTEIKNKLDNIEKLIEVTRKTREDAIKAKTECETKIKMNEDELAKMNIDPANIGNEIERLEKEIDEAINELQDKLPVDLLKQMGRI